MLKKKNITSVFSIFLFFLHFVLVLYHYLDQTCLDLQPVLVGGIVTEPIMQL